MPPVPGAALRVSLHLTRAQAQTRHTIEVLVPTDWAPPTKGHRRPSSLPPSRLSQMEGRLCIPRHPQLDVALLEIAISRILP